MSQPLNRRTFLAALSAVSALWAGGKSGKLPAGKDPYAPSFLHPNDRWVVLRGDKEFLYEIVDLETGKRVMTLPLSQCDTFYGQPELQFDPSGRYLVMGYTGHDVSIRRWDLDGKLAPLGFSPKKDSDEAGCPLGSRGHPEGSLFGVAMMPDGSMFTLPAPGGTLRALEGDWRLSDFRVIRRRSVHLQIPPLSGTRLASVVTQLGSKWSVVTPPPESDFPRVISSSRAAHAQGLAGRSMCWSHGENTREQDVCVVRRRSNDHVLIWSGYSTIREIDPKSGALIRCVSGSMPQTGLLAFGSSRSTVYAARPLDAAFRWNRNGTPTQGEPRAGEGSMIVPPGAPVGPIPYPPTGYKPTLGVRALARGDRGLALGSDQGDVWHGRGKDKDGGPWIKLGAHDEAVRALAFAPGLPWLLSGSRDGSLSLWSTNQGALVKQLPAHDSRINGASIHASGIAATCGPDGLRLWELEAGVLRKHIDAVGAWVSDVALSPDGRFVAGALLDGTVRMWDAENGALIWSAQADAGWCAALAFHPDGSRVSAGYELGQIVEWNAATGARVRRVRVVGSTEWQKGPRPVHALIWSQDGQALAAAFGDAVRVYDRNLVSSDGPGWLLPLDWADDYT